MEYFSTRNLNLKKSFSDIVIEGLAPEINLPSKFLILKILSKAR